MKKTLTLFFAALCALPSLAQGVTKPLPQDPSIRKGQLKNGLTYYIRHNAQTPGVAEFYIAQRVGSILEEPRQRGLAHFLEHMAFNGTKHFPGAEGKAGLREWCESVGIKFGTNLNAYTSVDQTVYNISAAPVTKAGVADTCLLILHDWSHYLLLKDEEIDKERGVIHEEWRTRRAGMAVQRLMEEATPVIYKGTKYEDCLPIGSMDVVDNFTYDALRDYYNKWYRPDLQAIIVVGDIDVDQMEQKIRQLFSPIPMPRNAARREYFPVSDNQHLIVFARADKEQPTCNFTLYMKRDATPRQERNREQYYRDAYVGSLVKAMLTDRLHDLAQLPDPPFMSASVRDGSFFVSNTKDAFSVVSTLKIDNVRRGILAAIGECERARQHGFTQAELDRAKAEELRIAENKYANRDKSRNRHFVNVCLNNFLENEPMLSEDDELRLVKQLGQAVTLDEVNRATREIITDRNQVVTFYTPAKNGFILPSDQEIESLVYTAQQQQYEPYTEKPVPTQLLSQLPAKGSVVADEASTNGYRHFTLSNGMQVYARTTDYEADRITMRMFSLGGQSLYPDKDDASMSYIASVVTASGVGDFTGTELDKALAGKTVRVQPFVGTETEGIQGSCNARDLETMFQLTHLYFTAPRRSDDVFQGLMAKQSSFLTNRDANPKVTFSDSLVSILYANHPRMLPMKKERLKDVSLDRIMQIYRERFANAGDFYMILTGAVDMETLKPLLEKYMASLPDQGVREQTIDRKTDIRPVDEVHIFRRQQTTPSAFTNIFYTAPIACTAENDLKLSVLCQLMRMVYTEKVREEKGGTYGVSVEGSLTKFPNDEALMKIEFRTDPDKYEELIPIIYDQLELMAKNGPSAENLAKVKEYEQKAYGQNIVTNGYWDYVKYHELREGIDFDHNYRQLVDGLTVEAIRDFCAQLLQPRHRIQVTMLPEKE